MTLDYFIREATPDDAEALIAYMKTLAEEPDNGITYSSADEFNYTVDDEREILRQHQEAANCMWLVAVTPNDEIIASANVTGGRRVLMHTVGIGMSVAQGWRNHGIGTALLDIIIAWCQGNPIVRRLELNVFTRNARAIHLYEKMGFKHEGIRKEAYYKDNQFLDAHVMAILFTDK